MHLVTFLPRGRFRNRDVSQFANQTLQDSAAEDQYKVRFLSDSKKHWQSRSLGALACFAVDLINIEPS